jgi:hypothetical protein
VLALSLGAVLIAAAIGGVLVARWRAMLGVAHSLLGACGLLALLFVLRGPPRGVAMGVSSFGLIAAGLLVLALLAGVRIAALRLRARPVPGLAVGVHVTIAISGIVILAAYALV